MCIFKKKDDLQVYLTTTSLITTKIFFEKQQGKNADKYKA